MRQRNASGRQAGGPRRRQARGARAHRACVSCKDRKLKCDDNSPTCANCERFGLECLIEDPETGKKRPRNYLETLEERLAHIERRGPQPSRGTAAYLPTQSPSALPSNQGSQQSPLPAFASEAGDHEQNSDLPSKVGMLDVKTNQIEPQYLGSSSTFAFAHIISPSLRGAIAQKSSPNQVNQGQNTTAPAPCPLPEYDVAITLSNAYFENIHPQYPFLHEPTFRRYEQGIFSSTCEMSDISRMSVPLFFINMVYSVGALLVPGYQHLAERLYTSSQLYPDVLSLDNLEAIQAILCYAMYSLRSAHGPSLWKLSGLAIRQCIELGYHRSTKCVRSNQGPLQLELRKRAFWCAQGIDCMYALRLGRPLGIQLHEVDADLPMDIEDSFLADSGVSGSPRISASDPPTSMSNAIHVIRLRRIWARVHICVHSTTALGQVDDETRHAHVAQLRSDLEEWRATAPQLRQRTGNTLSIFATEAWYDLNYSGTILHLYRDQLAEGAQTPTSVFIDCMEAASTVCRLYRKQYVGTSINHTWGTLHCIFIAGLVYLHCLWASPEAAATVKHHEVSKICTDCTMVLVVVAQGWEGGAPYRDIFEVLASRTLSMIVARSVQSQSQLVPATPALSYSSDRDNVTRWMADIDDMGMLNGFDDLLSGFVDDFTTYDMGTGSFS